MPSRPSVCPLPRVPWPRSGEPDRLAWPQLTRFTNELMNRILARVPAYFAAEYVATLDAALFANGLALSTISSIG